MSEGKLLTEEDIKKLMSDTVASTLEKIKASQPPAPEPKKDEPEEDDMGFLDNYYNQGDDSYEDPSDYSGYNPAQSTPQAPAQAYDPRVDALINKVEESSRMNMYNTFNNGWSNLVRERPECAEFTKRAQQEIKEMIKNNLVTTPEKMAHIFIGEKYFNSSPPAQAAGDGVNVGPSEVNMATNPLPEKPFRDMTDEEFEEWEMNHAQDKI